MTEIETIDRSELYPVVYSGHFGDYHRNNPNWCDIPEISNELQGKVQDTILDVFPAVFDNGATERYKIATAVACHHLRYRRAQCGPEKSRREAMKRAAEDHELSLSAVYEHIRSLTGESDIASFTDNLEVIRERYMANEPVIEAWKACAKIRETVYEIARITEAPALSPSDLTLQDVYRDQPGKRSRVLTADQDVIGLPRSESEDVGASVSEVEMGIGDADLGAIPTEQPIYLNENATVRTRDIATYQTEYSRVIHRIFEAVQRNMQLWGKQKPGPTIDSSGDDNTAVRAVLPYPASFEASTEYFARIEVSYWIEGGSRVTVTTHPDPKRLHDEKDPTLSGSIEEITEISVHALLGETMRLVEQFQGSS